ncbi:lipase family protein [Edwardsiella ictaluri]|uniref:lipase family protein n=1 Tax=Edwardsiella ictaluri TaxID=67780 RepID=UPI0039F6C762
MLIHSVATHVAASRPASGERRASTSGLQQTPNVAAPLASSRTSLNTSAVSSADLRQIKAERISLDDEEAIKAIKSTLIADVTLANFPYSQNQNELRVATTKGWEIGAGKLLQDQSVGPGQKNLGENGILTKSGLTAYLFINERTKEARVVFGGTTSGEKAGDLTTRTRGNFTATVRQWLANIRNVFSGTPDSYREAAQLVKDLNQNQKLSGYTLSVSGHSKGGGESAYAALMLGAQTGKPVTSINFSSAELGPQLKRNIADELAKKGVPPEDIVSKFNALGKNILHVNIKGDPVPSMHKLFGSISNIGKTLSLPNDNQSGLHLSEHVDFCSRVTNWAHSETMTHHHLLAYLFPPPDQLGQANRYG